MARAAMFEEPLERYLRIRIIQDSGIPVKHIEIEHLDRVDWLGCNWRLANIDPRLPEETLAEKIVSILESVCRNIELSVD